jgi:amidase
MQYDESALRCFVPDSLRLKPKKTGPLTGKTFVVKDCIAIAGHTSSFGIARWRETHPRSETTAPVVTNMLSAGAELLGMTKLDQLTYSLVGNIGEGTAPINPLYPDRFTGGSSSGSASAVAGKVADIGIGTDTGGSIRVPAASCGLFSLRPTHGRVNSAGVLPLAQSFDVVGILSRNPDALKSAFDVIDSPGNRESHGIGGIILPVDCLELVNPEIRDAVVRSAKLIAKSLGAEVVPKDFGFFTDVSAADLFTRIQGREIWSNYSGWVEQNRDFLIADVQSRLARAEGFSKSTPAEKKADSDALAEYRIKYDEFVEKGSIVMLPVMSDLPPKRTASTDELLQFRKMALRLNSPGSLSGCPETVMPVRCGASGLTYCVGLLGPRNGDWSLLNAVSQALGNAEVLEY